MKKHYLFTSKLVFENMPAPEKPGETGKETLDQLSKTIETSYKEQLLMMRDVNEKLSPVAKEQARHSQTISEMNEERAKLNYSQDITREAEFYGQTVRIDMNKDGSFQEYIDGKPIDFLNWLLSQQKSKDSNSNE